MRTFTGAVAAFRPARNWPISGGNFYQNGRQNESRVSTAAEPRREAETETAMTGEMIDGRKPTA
jgi:hypothetical protein